MSAMLPPEFVLAGVWLWENIFKEIIKDMIRDETKVAFAKRIERQWKSIEWLQSAKKYREQIFEIYSTMRMLGVPYPVSVEGIFTDLYIIDIPTAFNRYDIARFQSEEPENNLMGWFAQKNTVDEDNRINALELIANSNRLFILGKPGAGKTTLMKYVTLLAAKGEINKIPIFVSLFDWSESGKDLFEYIKHQFEICSLPDAELFITIPSPKMI